MEISSTGKYDYEVYDTEGALVKSGNTKYSTSISDLNKCIITNTGTNPITIYSGNEVFNPGIEQEEKIIYKMTVQDKDIYLDIDEDSENATATVINVGEEEGVVYEYNGLIGGWTDTGLVGYIPGGSAQSSVVATDSLNMNIAGILPPPPEIIKIDVTDDIKPTLDILVFDLIGIDKDDLTEEQIQYIRTGFSQAFDEDFAWGLLDLILNNHYDILYGDNYYYNLGKISTHNAVLSLNAASMEISKQGAGISYLTGLGAAEKVVTFTRVTASGGSAVISSSNAVVISKAISTTISSASDVCIAAVAHCTFAGKNAEKNFLDDFKRLLETKIKDKVKVNKCVEKTAEEANYYWQHEHEPKYENPPYKENTPVHEITLAEDTKFVRVFDCLDEQVPSGSSGKIGQWVMLEEDVVGLTATEIRQKFALPNTPIYITEVTLTEGTTIRAGICGEISGFGYGGGLQFDLMGQYIGDFSDLIKTLGSGPLQF